MTTEKMLPSDITLAGTRLLWREQVRPLRRSLWHTLARLLRRECRMFLTEEGSGRVLAKFTSFEDYRLFMAWLDSTHKWSFEMGREFVVAQHLSRPDASDDRTP